MLADEQRIRRNVERLHALRDHTVTQAKARGIRLRVTCLVCDRPKRMVDLKDLPAKYADWRLADLKFTCEPCKRKRRKPYSGPAGRDTMAEVVWLGEDPATI
jgi:RNase P subunit RPR2